MDRENFISNWNQHFPDYQLTVADLKNPHAVLGALFQIFDRLGIDRDAVLSPPPEESRNEHTVYYWDLLPVINVTRITNHLMSVMPQVTYCFCVTDILQPTPTKMQSFLLLLFNLMLFIKERLSDIAPQETELFSKTDEVKSLEDHKHKLLEMLNEQAEEKGKRAERLEKLEEEIKQLKEEYKQEKETLDEEKLELDAILKENHQLELVKEHKIGLKATLLAEVEQKRALRVYDADDVKAQAEKAAQNVQEAEKKLNSLQAILMEKENSLKNLQTIKPSLDAANNILYEIISLSQSENMRDSEKSDLAVDSKELEMLSKEAEELEAQLEELQVAHQANQVKLLDLQAIRQQQQTKAHSALRDAEDKDKKCQEQCKRAMQRTEDIKQLTLMYEEEKNLGMEELSKMEKDFTNELKTLEDALESKAKEVKREVEDELRNRICKMFADYISTETAT